ncbi:APC family permease [soil metagenome]
MSTSKPDADSGLIRAIGVPRLTANIVNATIGASIFAMPALMAAGLGAAAPVAFVICAIVMALLVTCFALAGSRVSLTGGLYAYAEVAFGRYVGFLAGLLYAVTAVLGVAAVVNVFADNLIAILPFLSGDLGRAGISLVVFAALAATNIVGVRTGANAVAAITITKLIPLVIFVAVGVFFIKPGALAWPGLPGSQALGDAVLLLLFAFVGIEVALMPSGEVLNPSRTVPRAIYTALAITTAMYLLIQAVAQGTLGPALADASGAPLATAAATFLGTAGRVLLVAGAAVSSFGFVATDILSSPRLLFAFGRDGILPAAVARVHSRFRTPHVAIAVYAAIGFLFSLTSSFEALAVMSNIAVLVLYLICCAAAWRLIRRDVRADGTPFSFRGAIVFPLLSGAVVLWILTQSLLSTTSVGADARSGLWITAAVCAAGTLLYLVRQAIGARRNSVE